tara:strand:+ start:2068 stop:2184 length:117 start_codon:yes stop_codon:yes gene_type:complete
MMNALPHGTAANTPSFDTKPSGSPGLLSKRLEWGTKGF